MNPVGYLINRPGCLGGERGIGYSYILAGNGVWIETEGKFLAVRIMVAPGYIRGLAPLGEKVVLRYGKIPAHIFNLGLNSLYVNPDAERYAGITWKDGYHIYIPDQKGSGGRVEYQVGDDVVMDLHSHGHMPPFFSSQDNRDEQGLKLFVVVGKLEDARPSVKLRVGVYGYFEDLPLADVFDGALFVNDLFEKEDDDVQD